MAKDTGKGAKSASKKGHKKESNKYAKMVIPLFLVLIMLGTVVAYVASSNWGNRINNSQSPNVNPAFNNIQDGLLIIPKDVGFARYADLKNDSVLNNTFNGYLWLKGSIPSAQIFNVDPQRDLFAIYPAGYFSNYNGQFVSLTDFGTSKINNSWPDSTGSDNSHNLLSNLNVPVKKVSDTYYYTPSTVPVISGIIDNVAPVAYVMEMGNTSLSSYGQYADLFDELKLKHIPIDNMTMEMVGTSSNLTYSDRYYAAVGPLDPANTSTDRLYSYVAIMHLNQTVPDTDMQNLALLQTSMQKMGFKVYNTESYNNYIVIEAQGSLGVCLDDMYSRWGFIKYQASM